MLPAKIPNKILKHFEKRPRLLQFYLAWLVSGKDGKRNGVKAYQSIHPNVTYGTAGVRSCQMLKQISEIDKMLILSAYGLGHDKYFQQMKEGIEAVDELGRPDHRARYNYHKDLGEILKIKNPSSEGGDKIQVVIVNYANNNPS